MNKQAWINRKVAKIMKEGVRQNTMKPYNSKTNVRKPVNKDRALAIAESLHKRMLDKK